MKNCASAILLLACLFSACGPATDTPQAATSTTEPAPTQTLRPTFMVTAVPTRPTASPIPATATSGPTPTSLPKLQAGQAPALTSLHMIDARTGWGTETSGHILHTSDGGQTWQDVTPPEGIYGSSGFFALDASTAWATQSQDCQGGQNCSAPPRNEVLWRTHNGGQSWQSSQPFGLNDPADPPDAGIEFYIPKGIHFINQNTGWLLASVNYNMGQDKYRLYYTTDEGSHWSLVSDNYTGPLLCNASGIGFQDPQNGWLGDNCVRSSGGRLGLYKTSDGGRTWDWLDLPLPENASQFSQDSNCGITKLRVVSPNFVNLEVECAVDANASRLQRLFYSKLGSDQSWHAWVESGAVDFIDAELGWRLFAGEDGTYTLEQTTDGGAHWLPIKTVQWGGSLDFTSETEGWALATSGDVTALVHTTDGGRTWEERKPVIASPPAEFTSIKMFSASLGWASISHGEYPNSILHTADGGLTWLDVTPAHLAHLRDYFLVGIFLDGQTAWIKACQQAGSCSLLRTRDAGQTWTTQINDIPFQVYYASFTFSSPDDGLSINYDVGAGQGHTTIYESHDGGISWEQTMLTNHESVPEMHAGGVDTCNICGDMFYYSPGIQVLVFGDLGSLNPSGVVSLSTSTDLGKTWRDQTLPLPNGKYADGLVGGWQPTFFGAQDGFLPIEIIKYNKDWSRAYNVLAVYATHDGGQTWQASPAVIEAPQNIVFLSPQEALAVCRTALCASHDGARSWQKINSNLRFSYQQDGGAYVDQFSFATPSLGWALLVNQKRHTLWKSTDGGQTWQQLNPVITGGRAN